ncbi:DUF1737 domain-containing protein [Propioniciclava sp. MC1595]|nr:DUF1737 domain-containing protein [Propioniciclava sp. MC1595]
MPAGKLAYRLVTGEPAAAFDQEVSAALGEGYTLAGSPTLAFSGEKVIAGQALVWSGRVPAVAPAAPASQAVAVTAETGEPADGADPDGTTRVDRPEPVGQED